MGKIKKLLENELVGGTQSTDIYPVTSTKAVYGEDNVRLDIFLNELRLGIEPKVLQITGFGTDSEKGGNPEVGQCYFRTSERDLRICREKNSKFDTLPFVPGAIYQMLPSKDYVYWTGTNFEGINGCIFNAFDFTQPVKTLKNIGFFGHVDLDRVYHPDVMSYRNLWIKVKQGNQLITRFTNFADSINIGFNVSMDYATMQIIDHSGGTVLRKATAPEDGYFFISYLHESFSGKGLTAIPPEISLNASDNKLYDINLDNFIKEKYYINSSTGEVLSSKTNRTVAIKVPANTKASICTSQYQDTCVFAYSKTYPKVGDTVTPLAKGISAGSGAEPTEEYFSCITPDEGYLLITYWTNKGYKDLIISGIGTTNVLQSEISYIFNKGADSLNFRNLCNFVNLTDVEASNTMTANQVIEEIYEPLREAYPEYITRRSLGKDASGLYDIWLYEFNNSVEEWFSYNNKEEYWNSQNGPDNVLVPGTNNLLPNQFCIQKDFFDSFFTDSYYRLYALSKIGGSTAPTRVTQIEENTIINGKNYYKFTCEGNVEILSSSGYQGIQFWWTKKVSTADQEVLIVSGTHGDEAAGYQGTALALQYLVEHYKENIALRYIHDNVKLLVIPCINMWGANQEPRVRTNSQGMNLNRYVDEDNLAPEQILLYNYIDSIKDNLSFYADFHTSELWNGYGMVYAVTPFGSDLYPAIVHTANYLCKSWFPDKPPYNWNIGSYIATAVTSSDFINNKCGINTTTVEFCGQDLMRFGQCSRWDSKYMKYCIETYLNFLIALCSLRFKNNSKDIINNKFFNHATMS